MVIERGIEFTHETVRLWQEKFALLITAKLRNNEEKLPVEVGM